MDPDTKKLTFKIHSSTFGKIEQSGGTGLLFGEGGIFQRVDNDGEGDFLKFEMPEERLGDILRLINSLPVSIRGEISAAGRQILRNGARGDGEQYTLIQGLRGFEGMELPSCLGLAYQYLKRGDEGSIDFWGPGEAGEVLRREFSLLQEDLEHDSRDAGAVAKMRNRLESQLAGRNGDDFADAWVFELDPNAIGVTVSPCREAGKPKEESYPLTAKKTHARDPLGRSAFLVVAPVGCGNCGEPDNHQKMRMLVGSTLLRTLRELGASPNPKDQDYLLKTGEALDAYSVEEGRGAVSSALKAYLAGNDGKDISDEVEVVDHFYKFLSWAETRSGSPIFICGGFGGRNSFYGLPEGFVSRLVETVEASGSGFSSHVFDTSHDPGLTTAGGETSGVARVAGVERVIASRSSQDWADLGKIRQKLFEELNTGSPDFLSLAMGSGTAGVGDAEDRGKKWKALKGALGPEFEDCDEKLVEDLVGSLRKFQEEWGGRPPKTGSLIDFTNFLLNRVGVGLPERFRGGLKDALEQVKNDGKKTSGAQSSLYAKMENRERLCELVGNAVFQLLGRGGDGKLSEEETEKEQKILRGLISNADKTENVYTMWRFGTPDIKFGKAKDVLSRGETLSQEGTPMLPLCSWSEVNIPVGDWNTSLLINALNLERGGSGVSFKGITGVLPSEEDGETGTARAEARRKRLGELLSIFGVDKNNAIDKESFADMLVDGLEARLGRAREAGIADFANYKTLEALVSGTASDSDLESRLARLMEDDCDTVKLGFGAARPNTSPMTPLLAQLLKARARMYQNVEGGDKTTTPEEVRDSTSSLLVASVLICGGVNDGDLPESLTVSEWSRRVATSAKGFGGALGQTRECRAATYKYRRQYGALNTEKMVLSAVEAFRIGDEGDMKTEVCGGLGYYLKAALTKIEAGLPEYVRASRRDYSNEIGMGGVEEAIRRYAHGNIYLSRPQALIQEEVAQYRKRKTEETQILSGDTTRKKAKPKNPKILADSQAAEKKDHKLEHPTGGLAGFAVSAGRGSSPER
jgi:hypothetical protein